MCGLCDEEDSYIKVLTKAKEDRTALTDEVLDKVIEYIREEQNSRLDQQYNQDGS